MTLRMPKMMPICVSGDITAAGSQKTSVITQKTSSGAGMGEEATKIVEGFVYLTKRYST